MPRLVEETPLGYRIEMDTGEQYEVPYEAALKTFPELFADPMDPQQVGQAPPTAFAGQQVPQQAPPVQAPPSQMAALPQDAPQMNPNMQAPPLSPEEEALNYDPMDMDQAMHARLGVGQDPSSIQGPVPNDVWEATSGTPAPMGGGGGAPPPGSFGYSMSGEHGPVFGPEGLMNTEQDIADQMVPYGQAIEGTQAEAKAKGAIEAERGRHIEEDVIPAREGMEKDRRDFDAEAKKSLMAEEQRIIEARAAIPTTDPGRVWKRMSGFAKAATILGAAMSGFRDPGGPNNMVAILDSLIKDDLDAQKNDIQTQRYNLLSAERGYERAVGRKRVERAVMLENHVYKLDTLSAHLDAKIAKMQDPVLQAQASQISAKIKMQAGNKYNELQQQNKMMYMEWAKYSKNQSQFAANMDMRRREIRARGRKKVEKPKSPHQKVLRMPDPKQPGKMVDVYVDKEIWASMSPEERKDRRNKMDKNRALIKMVDNYYEAVVRIESKYDGPLSGLAEKLSNNELSELKHHHNRLLASRAFELGGKQLSVSEKELIELQQGGYETWTTTDSARTVLPLLRKGLLVESQGAAESLGAFYKDPNLADVADTPEGQAFGKRRQMEQAIGIGKQPEAKYITPGTYKDVTGPLPAVGGDVETPSGQELRAATLRAIADVRGNATPETKTRLRELVGVLVTTVARGGFQLGVHDEFIDPVEDALMTLPPNIRVIDGYDTLDQLRKARGRQQLDRGYVAPTFTGEQREDLREFNVGQTPTLMDK